MTKKTITSKDVLRKALSLISKPYAWGQDAYYGVKINKRGKEVQCYCAVGAIRRAVADLGLGDSTVLRNEAVTSLSKRIRSEFTDTHTRVTTWNDKRGRTQSQVVALFKKAIASA